MPELIYHYTDNSGIIGIISNKELWLGDVAFVNDSEELSYARESISNRIRDRAEALSPAETCQTKRQNRIGHGFFDELPTASTEPIAPVESRTTATRLASVPRRIYSANGVAMPATAGTRSRSELLNC